MNNTILGNWKERFLKQFFVSDLIKGTHVGAQHDAVDFIKQVESEAYARGMGDIDRVWKSAIIHVDSQTRDSILATLNKLIEHSKLK